MFYKVNAYIFKCFLIFLKFIRNSLSNKKKKYIKLKSLLKIGIGNESILIKTKKHRLIYFRTPDIVNLKKLESNIFRNRYFTLK